VMELNLPYDLAALSSAVERDPAPLRKLVPQS
jgi:hypothetical protein